MSTGETFHARLRRVQRLTPDCTYRVDIAVAGIPRFVEQYGIDMDPDYQRGYVWTLDQKRKFVGAVLQNHHSIPIFWFNTLSLGKAEVVDGKQRLSAILGWLNGDYDAICPCGESFAFADSDVIGERNLDMMTTLKMHFVQLPRLDVLRFYLALNSGGTVHKPKDINRVRRMLDCLPNTAIDRTPAAITGIDGSGGGGGTCPAPTPHVVGPTRADSLGATPSINAQKNGR